MNRVVDIMLVKPGTYICANFCLDGVTSVRGNFCPKCAWEEAFHLLVEPPSPDSPYAKDPSMFDRVLRYEMSDKVGLGC